MRLFVFEVSSVLMISSDESFASSFFQEFGGNLTKAYYHGHRGGICKPILMNQMEGENKTVAWLVLVRIIMLGNGRLTLVQSNVPIFVKGVSE